MIIATTNHSPCRRSSAPRQPACRLHQDTYHSLAATERGVQDATTISVDSCPRPRPRRLYISATTTSDVIAVIAASTTSKTRTSSIESSPTSTPACLIADAATSSETTTRRRAQRDHSEVQCHRSTTGLDEQHRPKARTEDHFDRERSKLAALAEARRRTPKLIACSIPIGLRWRRRAGLSRTPWPWSATLAPPAGRPRFSGAEHAAASMRHSPSLDAALERHDVDLAARPPCHEPARRRRSRRSRIGSTRWTCRRAVASARRRRPTADLADALGGGTIGGNRPDVAEAIATSDVLVTTPRFHRSKQRFAGESATRTSATNRASRMTIRARPAVGSVSN